MASECLLRSDVYADYLLAIQTTTAQLGRAQSALSAVPDVGAAAAATTARSPGTNRLKQEITSIGSGVGDASSRIAELIAYLNGLASKYEALFQAAVAREKELAEAKEDG
ncbi:MAG TPA: hypothetical protein VIL34_23965 [Actinopolymorphaceae bacterium]|jgi:hypothetical protein